MTKNKKNFNENKDVLHTSSVQQDLEDNIKKNEQPILPFSENKNNDAFEISGRGELMLEILLTQMRREGFEMTVSPPKELFEKENKVFLENVLNRYSELKNKNLVSINMGQPNFEWNKIPLLKKMNNQNLKIKINSIDGKEVIGGFSLSIGNPHVIFFVEDFNKFNLKEIGPKIENHSYFPEKCNVTLANIKNRKLVKARVWERGAGLTKACGTAACATAVSGAVLKLSERCVDIEFPGGLLNIDWKKDNNIYMTGKVSEVKKITVSI